MKYEEYEDYSTIKIEYDNVEIPFHSKRNSNTNLGIFRTTKGIVWTDRYCGYIWLRDKNGDIIRDKTGEEVVLHIKPRFGLDLNYMLQKISTDDEFFSYLGLETEEPLIRFFHNEPLIENVSIRENCEQLISVISFISLLEKKTRISVMKRMIKVEENATGKLRGHLLMNKQVSKNLSQGRKERIYAVHNERSVDIEENRILLFALEKAESYLKKLSTIDVNVQRNITLIKNRMQGVSYQRQSRYRCEDIDKIIQKLPNIYRNYIPVFEYAKLILLEAFVSGNGNSNNARVVPYAINSHMLYECYVRSCIKEELKELQTATMSIEMLRYVPDKEKIPSDVVYGAKEVIKGSSSDCYITGKVVPDIVLKYTDTQKKNEFYRVYDVKYKDGTKQYKGRDDRLQILAYNLLYNVDNNTGFMMPMVGFGAECLNLDHEMYIVTVPVTTNENENREILRECIIP